MEVLTQSKHIEVIIDRLILAQNIYLKTSDRVHFDSMKEMFDRLKEHKKFMLKELSGATNIELDDHTLSTSALLKMELEKLGIELDHLNFQDNYNETLGFCIKRERDLLDAYLQALHAQEYDSSLEKVLSKQAIKTMELLNRLVKRQETGNSKKW